MVTSYDKAIAAFLTSLLGLLAAFNLNFSWLNPSTVAAVTPFVVLVVTWLVPNRAEPGAPPRAAAPPPSPASGA
jgi:hypothetical protein